MRMATNQDNVVPIILLEAPRCAIGIIARKSVHETILLSSRLIVFKAKIRRQGYACKG